MLTALEMVGLVAFAGSGALAAVRARLDVFGVIVVGLTTALGAGVIRNLLLREIPLVLRKAIYAVAALAGAVLVGVGHALRLPSEAGDRPRGHRRRRDAGGRDLAEVERAGREGPRPRLDPGTVRNELCLFFVCS